MLYDEVASTSTLQKTGVFRRCPYNRKTGYLCMVLQHSKMYRSRQNKLCFATLIWLPWRIYRTKFGFFEDFYAAKKVEKKTPKASYANINEISYFKITRQNSVLFMRSFAKSIVIFFVYKIVIFFVHLITLNYEKSNLYNSFHRRKSFFCWMLTRTYSVRVISSISVYPLFYLHNLFLKTHSRTIILLLIPAQFWCQFFRTD